MIRGQVAVEYMSYFAIFLLVGVIFTSVAYLYAQNEFQKQTDYRYAAVVDYVATEVNDVQRLSKYVDKLEYSMDLPIIVSGEGMTLDVTGDYIEGKIGDENGEGGKYYYSRVKTRGVRLEQNGEKVVIQKQTTRVRPPNLLPR